MICEGTKKIGNNEIDAPIGRSSNWRLTKRPRCTSNFQKAMKFNPIYVVDQNFKFQFFIFLN
jgi:hypothetical protein